MAALLHTRANWSIAHVSARARVCVWVCVCVCVCVCACVCPFVRVPRVLTCTAYPTSYAKGLTVLLTER